MENKKKMKNLETGIVWTAALVAVAIALLVGEHHLLWKIQEMNLFLNTALFFQEQLVVPGGFLSWASTFFTQFFYHPWLGVLMLCGWWLLLMWLTRHTFHIPDRWAVLTLIPMALLLITITDMGYWVYVLKLKGHVFLGTIGTTAVVALLWGFRSLPDRWWYVRLLYIVLVCAAGYMLIGIYGLAAAVLMGLDGKLKGLVKGEKLKEQVTSRQNGDTLKGFALLAVALLSAVALPLLCYRFIYYQTNLANIYFAVLPLYYLTESHQAYYLPYYLLALFFTVLAALPAKRASLSSRASHKGAANLKSQTSERKSQIASLIVLALLVFAVYHFWFKDENFHHELAMQHAIEQTDWEGVLEEARQQECEPTRAIVMMRNLALARLGRQGDEMFLYRNGSRPYEAPFGMRLMLVAGPLVYYQYGMLNYCNRLSTEMCVEFGWRPEFLKLMVKSAILSGEPKLARKYLGVLSHTTFFRDWAAQTALLLEHPEQIAKSPEMEPITHMMHFSNTLNSDQGYIERFLMLNLANSTYTGDTIFQEQALLATLWTHDINQFWRRFYDYIRLHPDGRMPRFYQEAAYLYGKLQGRKNLDSMPFDSSVKDDFNRFMQVAERFDNAEVEVAREGLSPSFGQTYFYDYYTMSQLPEF